MKTAAALITVSLAVLAFFLLLPFLRNQPWTPLRVAGAIVAVIGFGLVALSRLQLGHSFSVMPQAKALVTHGLYARIRNPMYVFVDVTVFGLILAIHVPWLLLFLALWMVAQARQAGKESKVLQEKFGQAYLDYRKQTWF